MIQTVQYKREMKQDGSEAHLHTLSVQEMKATGSIEHMEGGNCFQRKVRQANTTRKISRLLSELFLLRTMVGTEGSEKE